MRHTRQASTQAGAARWREEASWGWRAPLPGGGGGAQRLVQATPRTGRPAGRGGSAVGPGWAARPPTPDPQSNSFLFQTLLDLPHSLKR